MVTTVFVVMTAATSIPESVGQSACTII